MPSTIAFSLDTRGCADRLPNNANRALHANFFKWLERGNTALAQKVHSAEGMKAYTLSSLTMNSEGEASFRITLLDDTLLPTLEKGITPEVNITGQVLAFSKPHVVQTCSYLQIAQQAGSAAAICLKFLTPTSFSRKGMHYPLPDPVLVFASYRSRWNAFAPEPLQIADHWLDWLTESVAISDMQLNTQRVEYGDLYQQVGMVGEVRYVVTGKSSQADGRAQMCALADYAWFCGTGHKTTQGMGQTRRI